MSSGVTRMVTGSFVGTGSAVDVKTVGTIDEVLRVTSTTNSQ